MGIDFFKIDDEPVPFRRASAATGSKAVAEQPLTVRITYLGADTIAFMAGGRTAAVEVDFKGGTGLFSRAQFEAVVEAAKKERAKEEE